MKVENQGIEYESGCGSFFLSVALKGLVSNKISTPNGKSVDSIVAHSQGATMTTEALSELSSKQTKSLFVTYYGNASWNKPDVGKFRNVINATDFVPNWLGGHHQAEYIHIGFATHGLPKYMEAKPLFQ